MRQPLCLCAETPRLASSTEVVIVSHAAEARSTTNSARLAARVLVNCRWEKRGESPPASLPPAPHLLFPAVGARMLEPADRGIALVVPDGTWSQVAKMVRRDRRLAELPVVTLPPGPPSAFVLRAQRHAHGLCTYEAIARALGILEGPQAEARMLPVFHKMVEWTLWSRGRLPVTRQRYPLPPAALAFDRLMGARGGRKEASAPLSVV